MTTKKLFIINLFLLFTIFICTSNISAKATNESFEVIKPFYNVEFYEGDYHIFDKGYYIILGDGDMYPISTTGSIQSYEHYGPVTKDVYKSKITINSGHESAIDALFEEYSKYHYIGESDISIFLRVDNYAQLVYQEGDGAILYCFAVVLPQESKSNYHVVDFDEKVSPETIEKKYSYTDNVDSVDELHFSSITDYFKGAYPGYYAFYVEVTDTSGNVTTLKDYVYVHDFTSPTITTTKDNYDIEVNSEIITSEDILNDIQLKDNASSYGSIDKQITDTFNSQYNVVGTYSITYTATDSYGNSTTKVITINIKDTTAPSISLKAGGNTIYTDHDLSNEEIYNLLDISDNYDELTYDQISITSTSDGLEGVEYQVTVTATDSNNNTNTQTYTYYINDTTPPSITVRDTVYLEKDRKYTNEEIINILKAAGIINTDATTVNIINEVLVSTSKEEDIYTLNFEQVLKDGSIQAGSVTLRYQKEVNNNYIYVIIGGSILLLSSLVIVIKIKKKKHANS